MSDVRELIPAQQEIQILWRKREAPPQRKDRRKDRQLMWAWITNTILLGIICIMAVAIYILKAGPM